MSKLEKLYSIIERLTLLASPEKNSREVGVKLSMQYFDAQIQFSAKTT